MHKKRILVAVLATLPLVAQAVHNETIHLDEVNVTAAKPISTTQPDIDTAREQINKTAGGVTIVDMDTVREGRVSNYNDTLGMASGVLAQSRFGSEETRLSIRGSGLQRTFHGRGLKLMQDGIPVNLADGSFDFPAIDPYATSYIEVLRGANALQYGASNLGGSINFISPTGYTAPKFEVRGEVGSFGYKRLGIQTGGVVNDLDYFLTLSGYSQDSFRDDADQDAQRINGNIGYKISDTVETRFYFGYTNNYSELPGNLTKAQLRNNPEDSQNSANPGDPILTGTGVWERNIDLWRLANKTTFTWDNTKLDVGMFYSNKDLYHPIVDLAYLSFLPFPPFSTGTFATLGLIDQKTDDYGLTVRLQHNGEIAGFKNELVVGFSPTYGETEDKRFRNINSRRGAMTNNFDLTARNFEAYMQDTLHITPDFAVIAGLQYTDSKRKAKDKFINPATGDESYNKSYSQASPKLGVLYSLNSHAQIFANYSRSFEPPSFGELVNPAVAGNLKAQKGNTFEIGTRGNSEYVDWDVAVYYARLRDEMLAVSPFPGNTDTINADKTVHAGLEMGMTARLPMNLEWRHNLLVNQFKFDNDNTFGDNHLAGIPKTLMRAELLYRGNHFLPGFYIGPTVEWSPERYNVDFAETLYADSYSIWGLKAGQHVNEHWSWFLEGRNLGDKEYAASTDVLKQANATDPDRAFLPGDGRSVYAGFTWRY